MPLDTAEGMALVKRAASLVPAQFDPIGKAASFSGDSYEAYSNLVCRFAADALPDINSLAEFVAVLATPSAKARKSLKAAKVRLDWLLDQMSFETVDVALEPATDAPPELSVELSAIEPFDSFFAVARGEPGIARQTRFWSSYLSASSVRDFIRAFTRIFVTVALKQSISDTCSLPEVISRLEAQPDDHAAKSACLAPADYALMWVRADKTYFTLDRHGIDERVGNFFWGHLALLRDEFDTVEKAVAALPVEFNPELYAKCMQNPIFCASLLASFATVLGHPPLDSAALPAILEAFGNARMPINTDGPRALVEGLEPAEAAALHAEAAALGQLPEGDAVSIFLSPLAGKPDKVGSFWVSYFSATSTAELAQALRQGYSAVRLGRLTAALSRASRHRRLSRSYLAIATRSLTINTVEDLIGIFPPAEAEAVLAGLAKSQNQLTRIVKGVFSRNFHYRYIQPGISGECSICFAPAETAAVTPCRHFFCAACIGRWLFRNKTCPTCRAPLPKPGDSKAALPIAP